MRHAIHTAFKSAAERVLPVRSESAFKSHGVRRAIFYSALCSGNCFAYFRTLATLHTQVLTPEEFLKSGDYLVRTCSTWSWCPPLLAFCSLASCSRLQVSPTLNKV